MQCAVEMEIGNTVSIIHIAATLMMVGIIWFVQIVHYPLFSMVGEKNFREYEQRHTQLTGWVVGPLMALELTSAIILQWLSPANISNSGLWAGLILLTIIWTSTVFIQVPLHMQLIKGFDAKKQRRLVQSNWIRTAAWSLRGIVLL